MGALGAYDDDAEDAHCADFKRVKTEGARRRAPNTTSTEERAGERVNGRD